MIFVVRWRARGAAGPMPFTREPTKMSEFKTGAIVCDLCTLTSEWTVQQKNLK